MSKDKDYDIGYKDIEVNIKEKALSRCHHYPFAVKCYWLLLRYADGERLFYAKDLMKEFKIDSSTAHRFLEALTNLGYMVRKRVERYVHYELITNSSHPKLRELLPCIKKTISE